MALTPEEVVRLARKSLGIDDRPNEPLPRFYLDSFSKLVDKLPHDTNFIVELAVPGNSRVVDNGYGAATCMENYCWQDVILGPDPEQQDGGKDNGLGSFWEYELHCQNPDHLMGRNERLGKSGTGVALHAPDQQQLANPYLTSATSSPSQAGPSRSASTSSPSSPSFVQRPVHTPSLVSSLKQSSHLSYRAQPPTISDPRTPNISYRVDPPRYTAASRTIGPTCSGSSPMPHHSTTSALHRLDTNLPCVKAEPTIKQDTKSDSDGSVRKIRAIPSEPIIIDDSDDDYEAEIVALRPDQVPNDLRKANNENSPFILSDDEDDVVVPPFNVAVSSSAAGPSLTASLSASALHRSQSLTNSKSAVKPEPTSSNRTPQPKLVHLPVKEKLQLLREELEQTLRGYSSFRRRRDYNRIDALKIMKRVKELDELVSGVNFRPYKPPAPVVVSFIPGIEAWARKHGIVVVPPPTTGMVVNCGAPLSASFTPFQRLPAAIAAAGPPHAIAGPSQPFTYAKTEAGMPGAFPLSVAPPGMGAPLLTSGAYPMANSATGALVPTASVLAFPSTAFAGPFLSVMPGLNSAPGQDDDEPYDHEWDRPTGQDLQDFFSNALDGFSEDADIDGALQKLGMNSLNDKFAELNVCLMPHQILGVSWMLEKEKDHNFRGGMLCDAMGLGKTVQTIATVVGNLSEDRRIRTTLIVAPLALLNQWKAEIESKTTPGLLNVVIHHGSTRSKSSNTIKQADVVLTTYGTLVSEFGKEDKPKQKQMYHSDNESEEVIFRRKGPLYKIRFYRIVLDEAHFIRNRRTRAARAIWELDAVYRWCLTGTLIVNSLDDIFVHLKFLAISPAQEWLHFKHHISKHQRNKPKLATKRAQAILRTCMLRRHKNSELNGRRLLDLPPKTTEVVELDFTPEERSIYDSVEQRMRVKFNNYLKQGTILKHLNCVFSWLIRLRQMTCHPWLLRRNPGDAAHSADWSVSDEELFGVDAAAVISLGEDRARAIVELGHQWVDDVTNRLHERHERILEAIKAEKEEATEENECPICLDVLTDETIASCKHSFCRTCISEVFTNAPRDIDLTDEETSAGSRKCPLCRQIMVKNQLFSVLAFYDPERVAEKEEKPDIEDLDDDEDVKAESSKTAGKRRAVDDFFDVKPKIKRASLGNGKDRATERLEIDGYGSAIDQVLPSTKMQHLGELLQGYLAEDGTKIIVFSQFVSYLDLCSIYLRRLGIEYRPYTGAMRQVEREDIVREFTGPTANANSPRVLLISLKCGGVGLNLTAASKVNIAFTDKDSQRLILQVISLDLAWNAATENQAVDRAHRIGQTRPVEVKRLVIRNTVEQRMLAMQQEKEALSDGAMGEGTGGRLGRLSIGDLIRLFGVGAEMEHRD